MTKRQNTPISLLSTYKWKSSSPTCMLLVENKFNRWWCSNILSYAQEITCSHPAPMHRVLSTQTSSIAFHSVAIRRMSALCCTALSTFSALHAFQRKLFTRFFSQPILHVFPPLHNDGTSVLRTNQRDERTLALESQEIYFTLEVKWDFAF